MRPALVERLLAGLDDMPGSREIRFSYLEVDNVFPLRLERTRPLQDLERSLYPESANTIRDLHK
jgi:hypothetical protein